MDPPPPIPKRVKHFHLFYYFSKARNALQSLAAAPVAAAPVAAAPVAAAPMAAVLNATAPVAAIPVAAAPMALYAVQILILI